MNLRGDELGALLSVISTATRFMRHYQGEVVDDADSLGRGRVKVSIPDIGWVKASEAPWVEPEYGGAAQATPKVGSWVVVYFMAGDPSRPIYRGGTGEVRAAVPPSYTSPVEVILLDDGAVISYNRDTKTLRIRGANLVKVEVDVEIAGNLDVSGTVKTLAGTPAAVSLGLHQHPTATPGPPSPPVPGT